MALDLGGIAKGCAIDRAFAAAVRCGATPLLVDVGGNLRMSSGGGNAFCIGIRDPRGGTEPVLTALCRDGAFSTSGGYERFVIYDGRRYPHILDPATGRPGTGVLAVTVETDSACEADWMSTAVFLRGARLAERFTAARSGRRIWLFTPDTGPQTYRLTVFPAHGKERDDRLKKIDEKVSGMKLKAQQPEPSPEGDTRAALWIIALIVLTGLLSIRLGNLFRKRKKTGKFSRF